MKLPANRGRLREGRENWAILRHKLYPLIWQKNLFMRIVTDEPSLARNPFPGSGLVLTRKSYFSRISSGESVEASIVLIVSRTH